jgi:hypothetical protein
MQAETGRVLFLTTFYYPDNEELQRLLALQDVLTRNHVEIAFKNREKPRFYQIKEKITYHKSMRDMWLVYPGLGDIKETRLLKLLEGKG